MKLRAKIATTITSMMLALGVMGFAVWAAATQTLSVTNTVSFVSRHVLATVKGEVFGAKEGTYTNYASTKTLPTDGENQLGAWNINGDESTPMLFANENEDIDIVITIKNDSLQRYLSFELSGQQYAWNGENLGNENITRGVRYDIDSTPVVENALYTGQIVNVAPTKTAVITITLQISDTGRSVSAFDNSFDMTLRNVSEEEEPEEPVSGDFVYNPIVGNWLTVPQGATVTAYNLPDALFENSENPSAFYGLYTDPEFENKVSYPYKATQTKLYPLFEEIDPTIALNLIGNNDEYEVYYSGEQISETGHIRVPERVDGIPVTFVADWAFSNITDLTSISLPGTITKIGAYAFENCTSLASITIPASVQVIGNNAFANCFATILEEGTEGYSAHLMGANLMEGTTTLHEPVIFEPNSSLTEIGAYAFANNSLMETIALPDSVQAIYDDAFSFTNLTEIKFGNNSQLINVSWYAFNETPFFNEILNQFMDQETGATHGGLVYLGTLAWFAIPEMDSNYNISLFDYVIEPGTTRIAYGAFRAIQGLFGVYDVSYINSLSIPSSVKIIGEYAFEGVLGMAEPLPPPEEEIPMIARLTEKGTSTFGVAKQKTAQTFETTSQENTLPFIIDANGNEVISIGENSMLETIMAYAFDYNALSKVYIPASVKVIGESAFYNSFLDPNIGEGGGGGWEGESKQLASRLNLSIYETDHVINFANNSVLEEIGAYAFANNTLIKQIVIPASVKTIQEGAFYNSISGGELFGEGGGGEVTSKTLTSVMMEEQENALTFEENSVLQYIGAYAFQFASAITSVSIPDSVLEIGDGAFERCINLSEVHFGVNAKLETIGSSVFYGTAFQDNRNFEGTIFYAGKIALLANPNQGLSNGVITIKEGTTVIADDLMYYGEFSWVTSVVLPNTLKTIGWSAFYGTGISVMMIPTHVEIIRGYPFPSNMILLTEFLERPEGWQDMYVSDEEIYWGVTEFGITQEYIYIGNQDDSVTIVKYIGDESSVFVPNSLNGKTVSVIGRQSFSNVNGLAEVILSEGIVSIESNAFNAYSSDFMLVYIPSSVSQIAADAFNGYANNLTIFAGVESDKENWQGGWNNSRPVVYDVSEIAKNQDYLYAVMNNDTVRLVRYIGEETNVVVPSHLEEKVVTTIMSGAFDRGNAQDRGIYLPQTIETVEQSAFSNDFHKVYTDSSLKPTNWNIGSATINAKLSGGYIYQTIDAINIKLVRYMGVESNLEIPTTLDGLTVKTIGTNTFNGINSLKTVTVSASVTTIEYAAFKNLSNLQMLYLPSTITTIASSAISSSYKAVIVAKPASRPAGWNSSYFNNVKASLYGFDNHTIEGDYFYSVSNNEATILKYFGYDSSVIVPQTLGGYPVTTISTKAFEGSYISIVLPKGLKTIKSNAIEVNSIYSVFVPNTVETIESFGIRNSDYKNFDIYVQASSVPGGWVSNWKTTYGRVILNTQKLEITEEYSYAVVETTITILKYHGSSTSVVIPENIEGKQVTVIGTRAFFANTTMTSVVIPNGVTHIKEYAFSQSQSNVSKLVKISLPNTLIGIESQAFYSINSQANYFIAAPKPETSWNGFAASANNVVWNFREFGTSEDYEYLIHNNNTITLTKYLGSGTEIIIPSSINAASVMGIAKNAFYQLNNVISVFIPSTITEIANSAFYQMYPTFYVQAAEMQPGWVDGWYSYYSSDVIFNVQSLHSNETFAYVLTNQNEIAITKYLVQSETEILTIPEQIDGKVVTTIEQSAFYNTQSFINYLVLPSTITTLKARSIANNVINVFVPTSVTNVSSKAFASSNLSVFIQSETIPETWAVDWNDGIGYNLTNASGLLQNEDYRYVTDGNTVVILKYIGMQDAILIPSQIENIPVGVIGSRAFANLYGSKTYIIPSSVTKLMSYAFTSSGLLYIPSSVIEVDRYAASDYNLKVFVQASQKPDGWNASWNGQTSSIVWGASEFKNDANFIYSVFANEVTILKYIGSEKAVVIPSIMEGFNVTKIGSNFINSNDLNVKAVIFPNTVTTIQANALSGSNVHTVYLPQSVQTIESQGMGYSSNIRIYAQATGMQAGWASNWKHSSAMVLYNINEFVVEGDVAYQIVNNEAIILRTFANKIAIIPSTVNGYIVTTISDYAVSNDMLYIPNTVSKIESNAFYQIWSYHIATAHSEMPSGWNNVFGTIVYHIYQVAMEGNFFYSPINDEAILLKYFGQEEHLTLPTQLGGKTLTSIRPQAFTDWNLKAVFIPNTVLTINANAFPQNQIAFFTNHVSYVYGWDYNMAGSNFTIQYDANEILIFTAEGFVVQLMQDQTLKILSYEGEENQIVIPSYLNGYPVSTIGSGAFSYSNFTNVVISEGITIIEDSAFNNSANLTEVILPFSLQSIGVSAFASCTNLISIMIPSSVTFVGSSAFRYSNQSLQIMLLGQTYNWDSNWNLRNATSYSRFSVQTSQSSGTYYRDQNYLIVVENNQATIVSYTGNDSVVIVPSDLNGYPVTSVAWGAFKNLPNLTRLEFPHGLISIGQQAIEYCSNLKEVFVPNSVKTIGYAAFGFGPIVYTNAVTQSNSGLYSEMTYLNIRERGENEDYTYLITNDNTVILTRYIGSNSTVIIPSEIEGYPVTMIGNSAFYGNEQIKHVVLSNNITSIGSAAFYGANMLHTVELSSSLVSIGSSAFKNNVSLTSIAMPATLQMIGENAFEGCNNIVTISLNEGLKEIGNYAFASNSKLKTIVLPESLEVIGHSAFADNFALATINIPSQIKEIKSSTFYDTAITSIVLPEGVQKIGSLAFGSRSLQFVYIPQSVEVVEQSAFGKYDSSTTVYVANATKPAAWNKNWIETTSLSNNSVVWGVGTLTEANDFRVGIVNNQVTIYGYWGTEINLVVPSTILGYPVVAIGEYAFASSKISTISLPNSIVSIKERAFYQSRLTSIDLPSNLRVIEKYAFYGCSLLTSVSVGTQVEEVGAYAFAYCTSLTSIALPSATTVGYYAFLGCKF